MLSVQLGSEGAKEIDYVGKSGYGLPINEIIRVARRRWIALSIIMMTCIGMALLVNFTSDRVYRSETLVNIQAMDAAGLPQTLGQFQGVAQAVGLNVGGGNDRGRFLSLLRSRVLSQRVILKHELASEFMAPDSVQVAEGAVLARIVERFRNGVLSVDDDRPTGVVTVGIEWTDAKKAMEWTRYIIEEANAIAREKAIRDAELSLKYLQSQLDEESTIELREAIYRLIEIQMNRSMLANVRQEYTYVTLDPPSVPFRSIRPKRLLNLLIAGLAGMFICSAYVLIGAAIRKNSDDPS